MRNYLLWIGLFTIITTISDFSRTTKPEVTDVAMITNPAKMTVTISGVLVSDYVLGRGASHGAHQYKNLAKYRISNLKKTIPLKYGEQVNAAEELESTFAELEVIPKGKLVINWRSVFSLVIGNALLMGLSVFFLSQIIHFYKSRSKSNSKMQADSATESL